MTIGNSIHHNVITYRGDHGQSGTAADFNPDGIFNGNKVFDFNPYHAHTSITAAGRGEATRTGKPSRRKVRSVIALRIQIYQERQTCPQSQQGWGS